MIYNFYARLTPCKMWVSAKYSGYKGKKSKDIILIKTLELNSISKKTN